MSIAFCRSLEPKRSLPKRKGRRQQVHAGAVMHSSALWQHHGLLLHPSHHAPWRNQLGFLWAGIQLCALSVPHSPEHGERREERWREVQKGCPGCSSSLSASTWYKGQKLLLGHFCHSRETPQSAAWPLKWALCHEVKTLSLGVTKDVVKSQKAANGTFTSTHMSFSLLSASMANHPSHPASIQVLQPDLLEILALGASSVSCLKHPLFPMLSISSLSHNT